MTSQQDAAAPGERGAVGESAAVVAFWHDLGLPGLVDIHTHFMPANVLAKVWAFFDQGSAHSGHPWPIVYRHPEDERVAMLRAFGVRRFSALAYPHKPGMAAWLNGWEAEFAARTPDALHSATFFPEPGADAYVAEAITAGARLFKAHLQVGGYDPRDELLGPVWGLLAESRVPVVVHCGSGPDAGAVHRPRADVRGARAPPAADRDHRPPRRARVRRFPRPCRALSGGLPGYHDGLYRLP